MPRFGQTPARYRAVRAGCITGLILETADPTTTGSITVTVYNNDSGEADNAGSPTSVTLTMTTGTLKTFVQARDLTTFDAGDELYLRFSGSSPNSTMLRCSFEVET